MGRDSISVRPVSVVHAVDDAVGRAGCCVWAEVGVPLVARVAVGRRPGLVRPTPVRVQHHEAVLRDGGCSNLV